MTTKVVCGIFGELQKKRENFWGDTQYIDLYVDDLWVVYQFLNGYDSASPTASA